MIITRVGKDNGKGSNIHFGRAAAAAAAKSLQSYPTLCDPIAGSPPGSSVPGILQARTLEWVAIFLAVLVRLIYTPYHLAI